MNPLALAWIASLAGAALFFAAGALAARGKGKTVGATAAAGPTSDPTTTALRTALDRLTVQRDHLEHEGEQARGRVTELDAVARRAAAAQHEAERARDGARAEAARAAAAVTERDHRLHGLEAAIADRDRKIVELQARAVALEEVVAERDRALAEARTKAKRAEDAAVLARGEAERDAQRVLELEGSTTRVDAEGRHQELVMALEAARARAAEGDALRDDHARLRAEVSRAAATAARVTELEAEVATLRAKEFARPKPPAAPTPLRAVDSTENALKNALSRIVGPGGVRSAVLADDLGLAVASVGELDAELAAFGAYLVGVGRKARDHLPLGALRAVNVEDEHGTAVRVIAGTDPNVVLVTLAAGPGPALVSARRALDDACAAIYAGSAA